MKKLQRLLLCLIVVTTALFTALQPAGVSATTTYFSSKSSDGYISYVSDAANAALSWSSVHDNATGGITAAANESRSGIYTNLSGTFITSVSRGYILFDTSSLPDTAIITSADIQLYVTSKYAEMGATDYILSGGTTAVHPHDPLEVGDYLYTNYTGSFGSLSTSSISTSQYNTWTLTAAGKAFISLTTTTKFILREKAHDYDNVVGTFNYSGGAINSYIQYYAYEAGSSYYPILNITYTLPAAPTVTADAATAIADTTATLNGTIDDDGGYPAGVSVKWAYGTTSQTSANFALYDTVDANFAGTFSTGETPSKNVAGLTKGITYYYRFQAKNTTDTTTSDEMSFTTLIEPTVVTVSASNISTTTVRLNGNISNSGGEVCQVRWGYGETTQTDVNFAAYDTVTALAGSYTNGDYPYYDVTGLTASTLYYFRFQATNSIGTTTSGELSFTTSSGVSEPSSVVGIPTPTTIKLTWTSGDGAIQYMVRVGAGAYPTTTVDGTQIYYGTSLTTTISSLTPGTTYYYSIWGESGGTFSATYITCMVTTQAGSTATSSSGVTLSAPWRWMAAPNYTNLSNIPIVYDAVNATADSLNMPRESFWMVIALLSAAFGGVLAYMSAGESGRGQQSQFMGMAVGCALLILWWIVQIVPWYIIGLDILFTALSFRAKREMD